MADLLADAHGRYQDARERARLVLEAWVAAERPFTVTHSNRTVGVHPLYKALLEAEAHAERMSRPLRSSRWFVPRVEPETDRLTELSPAGRLRAIRPPASAGLRSRANGLRTPP